MTTTESLTAVRRAALGRERAEAKFRGAIFSASADGHSLRTIGAAAGVSHVRILQIVRGEAGNPPLDALRAAVARNVEAGGAIVEEAPEQ